MNVNLIKIVRPKLKTTRVKDISYCRPTYSIYFEHDVKEVCFRGKLNDVAMQVGNRCFYSVIISDLVKVSRGFKTLVFDVDNNYFYGQTLEGMEFKFKQFVEVTLKEK